jgi:hypothetical protein
LPAMVEGRRGTILWLNRCFGEMKNQARGWYPTNREPDHLPLCST